MKIALVIALAAGGGGQRHRHRQRPQEAGAASVLHLRGGLSACVNSKPNKEDGDMVAYGQIIGALQMMRRRSASNTGKVN